MATATLSKSLLDTNLNSFVLPSTILDLRSSIAADIDTVIQLGAGFDNDPTVSGTTLTYKNPTYLGDVGNYQFTGTATSKFSSDNELTSSTVAISGARITTNDGVLTVKGSLKSQITTTKTSYTLSYSELSFVGDNETAWSMKGAISENYSYDVKTDTETWKSSSTISALSITDINKNNVSLSGSLKYNSTSDTWSGNMTSLSLTLNGTKLSASGLKLTYDSLASLTSFGTVTEWSSTIFSGNDSLTISSTDAPQSTIYGYAGNDKITGGSANDILHGDSIGTTSPGNDMLIGGSGNDTLNGGGGTDLLTGGTGADTFVIEFSNFNFTSSKTLKLVTVSDFKNTESDQIQLIGFGNVRVVDKMSQLKGQTIDTTVIYESSTGKFWYDSDSVIGSGTATLNFAKVVGVSPDYFA